MSYARMARIKPLKTREQIVFYPFLTGVSIVLGKLADAERF